MGDDILSLPFLNILAAELKNHDLHFVILPGRRELFGSLDRYRIVEPWETDKVAVILGRYHDIVFDLGFSTTHLTNGVFEPDSLRYGTYVGFAKPTSILREVTVPVSPDIPMWQQYISLASAVGIRSGSRPECQIETSDFSKRCAEILVDLENKLPLVCVAPGTAGGPLKQWPAEYFATLIRMLNAKRPLHFVLVGELFEMGLGDTIAALAEVEIDNLMGLTPLGSFVHIVKNSKLVVANDNGAMHLGGLLNTPTIGLFGPSNPVQFQPLGKKAVVIHAGSGNMTDIDPPSVAAECLHLLDAETA
ncbi:MAG TPA: glycosyltransferase family 9 protein [Desulfomonilaceae bacterium]|nr:glycosyltransferase family 9 protein [Desulfomonilaceae bacterium]